jgi:hypothetical protein
MTEVPAVLAAPPWIPPRKRPTLVLRELAWPDSCIAWTDPGEPPAWADPWPSIGPDQDRFAALDPEERDRQILEIIATRGIPPIYAGRHLSLSGIKSVLATADQAFVEHYCLARIALAKFGLEVLENLLRLFDRAPRAAFDCLRRIDSPRVAEKLSTHPALAEEWYERFPRTAARLLLPDALTGKGKDSLRALGVLSTLVARGHEHAVLALARELGDGAAEELQALLAPPRLPAKPPRLPPFVDLATLPIPKLRSGTPLEPEQIERLLQLLACLPLVAARVALADVKQACEPDSLGDLCRALVDRWVLADSPAKEKWVLAAAAFLGDDLVTHRLAENIAHWAAQGKHTRVTAGVEALASLASDVALMHLSRFAEKSKVKSLKKKAEAALDAYRAEHGLNVDELADRTVVDLGLDARGELVLSYGPRSFRVVFDDSLAVSLRDGDKPLRSLPRALETDDPQLVARAQAGWQAIKKETKPIIEAQARRLERAMAARRTWSHDAIERYYLRHPLMQHFARRLVWAAFDAAGSLALSFRIAEDTTFASIDDERVDVPPEQRIGIVHPLALGPELSARWGEVLSDYRIVQPFAQLSRETFVLEEAERTSRTLTRFAGVCVEGSRFFSLKHRGWEFFEYEIGKRMCGDCHATLSTEPGLDFLATKPETQTLGDITLHFAPSFSSLTEIEASELIRDVEMLRR